MQTINKSVLSTNFDNIIEHLAEILPSQGPLKIFIHHNTLHAFEAFDFYEGLEKAAHTYNAKMYLSDEEYDQLIANGRISTSFIAKHLKIELSKLGLEHPLADLAFYTENYLDYTDELDWLLKNSYSLFSSDTSRITKDLNNLSERRKSLDSHAKWVVQAVLPKNCKLILKSALLSNNIHLDYFAKVFCFCLKTANLLTDKNLSVNRKSTNFQKKIFSINSEDHFLKICASYIDQDFAEDQLIQKEYDFLNYGIIHLSSIGVRLGEELDTLLKSRKAILKEDFFRQLLNHCFNDHQAIFRENNYHLLLERLALRFPGWAGAFVQRKQFFEYLCLLLIFKKVYGIPLTRQHDYKPSLIRIASRLYYLINQNNIDYTELEKGPVEQLKALASIFYELESGCRLRILHKAYEDTIHSSFLELIQSKKVSDVNEKKKYNFVFCIDEREESFRRYVEQESQEVATFGYAGFFGLDASLLDEENNKVSICPPLVTPSKVIKIRSKNESQVNSVIDPTRILYNLQLNPLSSAIMSFFTPFYLAYRLIVNGLFKSRIKPSIIESHDFDYMQSSQNPEGFSAQEMAVRVHNLIRIVGLSVNCGKYVIILGHGAASANNPYKSAYDCGACGGRPGDVNAKLFAEMANRKEVREELKKLGLILSDETIFIGGYHNTTTDDITLFDTERLDPVLSSDISEIKNILDSASFLNAKERSRRFKNMKTIHNKEIINEIKKRAYYIAEPRPEYGHATNAFCVVGSRSLTSGLFFDRRAFLVSYDRTVDTQGDILAGILKAIVPVCMGINLEYFFSSIDNYTYGAGSKLPQNVVAGIATMTGSLGDIRTGLPKQMIEIHEPIRLAMLLETDRATVEKIILNNPNLANPIHNGWLRLFLLGKDSSSYTIVTAYRKEDETCLGLMTKSGSVNHSAEHKFYQSSSDFSSERNKNYSTI